MQPLTYEDVSACITFIATSTHKCSIKNALAHTYSCFFLRRRIYIPFCHIRLMSVSRTFQLLLLERITFDIQGSVVEHFCLDRHVCTQVIRLRVVFMRMFCLTRTRYSGWSERTMIHFQCKRHVSPYEAMGTRVRVRLRVRFRVRLRARVIEQSQVGNNQG